MKKKYSIASIVKNSLSNNENWGKMWRNPNPKKHYDVIIVGGGGHGLGTAYYLAKHHGIKNIAVIGTGVIGVGWIIRCLAHNKIVHAYDKDIKLKKI